MPFHALASLIFARSDFDTDFLDRSSFFSCRCSALARGCPVLFLYAEDDLTMATARLRAKLPAATSNDGSSLHWF